jgi:hypothetical protein
MIELSRDDAGRVRRTIRNMANATVWEYIKYFMLKDYLMAVWNTTKEMFPLLLYWYYLMLILVTFPVSMPIIAYIAIRKNRKELDRLTKGGKA